MRPEFVWWISSIVHKRGFVKLARLIAGANYFIFKVDLPAECEVERDLVLFHRGIGVVVNPNVKIGTGVRIVHGVTIGAASAPGKPSGRVVIGKNVRIGAGATIIAAPGELLTVGTGAQIGAMAYVRKSVPDNSVVFAPIAEIRDVKL